MAGCRGFSQELVTIGGVDQPSGVHRREQMAGIQEAEVQGHGGSCSHTHTHTKRADGSPQLCARQQSLNCWKTEEVRGFQGRGHGGHGNNGALGDSEAGVTYIRNEGTQPSSNQYGYTCTCSLISALHKILVCLPKWILKTGSFNTHANPLLVFAEFLLGFSYLLFIEIYLTCNIE